MLGQHCMRILSSKYCSNTPEITLHKKITCTVLTKTTQIYFCRETGCFKYV